MHILMVCLGNICRSPLAEGILKHHVAQNGLDWQVDSAGTSFFHVGELPDPRSIQEARRHGIDITDQRARQFKPVDFIRFDRILVMDRRNYHNVLAQASDESQKSKVELMLNYLYPGEDREVPDPYYDDDGFSDVFDMLNEACVRFIQSHQK
jgi:protein-tyrosine phosphatase